MIDPITKLHLEQLYTGVKELAAELRNSQSNKNMCREFLANRAELLAWRFKSLDDEIKRIKELPTEWQK